MSKKRKIINFRKIGDQINPENMTHKEYINYLCHKFGFRIAQGWDGVDKRVLNDRRANQKDIRKNKVDRRSAKQRRIHERNDAITFYLSSLSAFLVILIWFLLVIYFNYQ